MSDSPKRTIHPLTLWIPIILMAGGLMVFWNYLVKLQTDKAVPRLPVLKRIEKSLEVTEQSGEKVQMKDLKGKIIVACWVYTNCPRGCPGVVGELLKLYKDFGSNPDVHFLSVSVDPDDTPEMMRKFTSNFGIKGDNWWFINGAKDELRVYMTRYFGFQAVQDVPEKDRLSPDDKFLHDMKVALVDDKGQVRGFYDIASPDPEFATFWKEKIRTDIKTLLEEKGEK